MGAVIDEPWPPADPESEPIGSGYLGEKVNWPEMDMEELDYLTEKG